MSTKARPAQPDTAQPALNIKEMLAARSTSISMSGIRRIFDLGATLKDPINLSIGQPDFETPEPIKAAAIEAIRSGRNGYSLTQGAPELRDTIATILRNDLGWDTSDTADGIGALVTSGTSGALYLAMTALLNPGDEAILADPYFVAYPNLVALAGGTSVFCDVYPDGKMTAERIEPLITERTKFVLLNTPANPTGVVLSQAECDAIRELCARRGVLLISDEIYDEFLFPESRTATSAIGTPALPSPCRGAGTQDDVLLIRGFGKTFGLTGWRLGYAAGPRMLLREMAKLQQFTFVCAPTPLQYGCTAVPQSDMSDVISEYARRRDMVVDRLSQWTDLPVPGGAFYAFAKVPERLGMTGTQFCEKCIERNLLLIPGGAFSQRDTHFRLSFASPPDQIERGLDIIGELMG